MKRHSIKEIASHLGVSATTVSFVLNGKGPEEKISTEMIERVTTYAKKINYKPNMLARSLRTGKTKILVFMVEDISNYFFSHVGRYIEEIAHQRGYRVIFCSNENDDARSRDLIALFLDRQVDGFILIPSSGIRDAVAGLMERGVPVILFDRYFPDLATNHVVIDNYGASLKATQHLIANGYRHISFVTTDVEQIQMLDRSRGYTDAVSAAGLPMTILRVPFADTYSERAKDLIREHFTTNDALDAVFFSTNYLTQSGLEIVKEPGSKSITELGILTFDDNDLFRINTPTISAVAQPMQQLAEELMRIMLLLLKQKGKATEPVQVILPAELIVRGSSARAGTAAVMGGGDSAPPGSG